MAKKMLSKRVITGKDVVYLETIPSWWARGNVTVVLDGDIKMRIQTQELLKMMKHFTFIARQSRVHTYLEDPKLKSGG